MYVSPETLDCVLNYLQGHDDAMMGGLLVGFRESLIMRLGTGDNFTWTALVGLVLKAQGVPSDDEQARIEGLFVLLEQYFDERNHFRGLFRMYRRYDRWLSAQNWYKEIEEESDPIVKKPPNN